MRTALAHRGGVERTPKVRIELRFSDALGHGRGQPYGSTTPAAQNTAGTSLRGSGGLLLSCGSPPAASRGQPTHTEAHSVVAHVLDGLRATGSIVSQRPVAKAWSADLTTAPTSTAEEPHNQDVEASALPQQAA